MVQGIEGIEVRVEGSEPSVLDLGFGRVSVRPSKTSDMN